MQNFHLSVNLGSDPITALYTLQKVKDAMSVAIMQKIENTGIQDGHDPHFTVWQSLYLEADYQYSHLYQLLRHCPATSRGNGEQ